MGRNAGRHTAALHHQQRHVVVVVPVESVFQRDGSPVVYKLDGSIFQEQRIEVARRGREQAIVSSGVAPGDRIATRRPGPDLIRSSR